MLRANIDPGRNYLHRSLMRTNTPCQYHFCIQRHAVQHLLRLALDAAPMPVSGLLGGRANVVDCVFPLDENGALDAARYALLRWQQEGMQLLATYSSEGNSSEENTMKKRLARMLAHIPASPAVHLPHLKIRTDTNGRIEVELHSGDTDQANEIWPLEMQEDGGLYPRRDNS